MKGCANVRNGHDGGVALQLDAPVGVGWHGGAALQVETTSSQSSPIPLLLLGTSWTNLFSTDWFLKLREKKLWIYYHGILISFFSKFGRLCFSLCMVIYLLGDLAIYCAAVAKSLRWWCWCWQCCWWKCWQSSGQENVKIFDFDFDFGLWLYMTYNEFYPKRSAFFPVFFYPFPYILLPFSDLHR